MPDLNILHEMIKASATVPLTNNHGKKIVTLFEPLQPDSVVTIVGIPDAAIVIKADAFRSPDTVFEGARGECKRADFVIVADSGNKKTIIYIEMKATKSSRKEIVKQLAGARCFVSYCQEIGKEFWSQSNFLKDYTHRFVSIGHTSISKRKTRIERTAGIHDHPERMLKISSPNRLEFNHLAGKA